MRLLAANGILILLPSAFALASMADAGRFDALFNMRDGLRLAGRLTPRAARRAES